MNEITQELIKKYDIDIDALSAEQEKLAGELSLEDVRDFSEVQSVAGIDNAFFENKIISVAVVLEVSGVEGGELDSEALENVYFSDKLRFPYVPEFRAYRELQNIVRAVNKLDAKPDLVFIRGHGISHPRGLGLASHFSLSTGIPTIGIAENLLVGEVAGEDVLVNEKKVGKVFQGKKGAKPFYISPGNLISVETAFELTKKFIISPHKIPEPLHAAHKYAKKVRDELRGR